MTDTRNALDAEKNFITLYNSNSAYRNMINELIGKDFDYASKVKHHQVSEEWTRLTGKTKKDSAKADFLLENKTTGETLSVSFKEGKGRPTSSNYVESKGYFCAVLEQEKYRDNEELVLCVERMLESWESHSEIIYTDPDITTDSIKEYKSFDVSLTNYIDHCQKLNNLYHDVIVNYEDYMIDVMKEILTGSVKFRGTKAEAKFYLQTFGKRNLRKIKTAMSVEDEDFEKICNKYLKNKRPFAMKSSCGGNPQRSHWIRIF
jgi:hypothetical protein